TLVGVNYSGALLPMIFESIPVRIDGVVFLDGLVPLPGESVAEAAEMALPGARETWDRAAAPSGHRWLPPDAAILDWMLADLPEVVRTDALARMRPQPYATIVEPVQYSHFPSAPPFRAYIRCQKTPIANSVARMARPADAE